MHRLLLAAAAVLTVLGLAPPATAAPAQIVLTTSLGQVTLAPGSTDAFAYLSGYLPPRG